MRWRSIAFVLMLLALMIIVTWRTAAAQDFDRPHHRAVVALCGWELERYCAHSRAGHLVCLARHAERLGPVCYRVLRVAAAMDGCEVDYRRYCADVPPGGGRVLACLRGNADRLSPVCVRALRGPTHRAGFPYHAGAEPDLPGEEPWHDQGGPVK